MGSDPEHVVVSRVRAERLRRGWSQAKLADRARVSRAEVSAIETERLRSPSAAAALRLAAAFGLTVEELFLLGSSEEPEWAWEPAAPEGCYWSARVGKRTLLYPVEHTLTGALAHDGVDDGAPVPASPPTVVIAGCDPAAGLLAEEVGARAGYRVLALPRTGEEARELVADGRAHLGGIHGIDTRASARAIVGPGALLLRVASWDVGVALADDVEVLTVEAARRADLRWANHELASLRDPAAIASAIREGWAQAGVCTRLVAEQAGLRFLPTKRTVYDLCAAPALRDDPAVRAVATALAAGPLQRRLAELPGTHAEETGKQSEVW